MKEKKVTDVEYTVLELLWKSEEALSVAQVVELMEYENGVKWAYTTGGTVLRRMEKKGYVHSTKRGATFFYTAVLQKHEVLQKKEIVQQAGLEKAANVIENCFQGSFSKFLAAFSCDRKLTQEEFDELKEWVKQHDDDY